MRSKLSSYAEISRVNIINTARIRFFFFVPVALIDRINAQIDRATKRKSRNIANAEKYCWLV